MLEFGGSRDIKKTRRDHTCDHCGLMIPKGFGCSYWAGKYDGDFQSVYEHHECAHEYREINHDSDDEWMRFEDGMGEYDHRFGITLTDWREGISKLYGLIEPSSTKVY